MRIAFAGKLFAVELVEARRFQLENGYARTYRGAVWRYEAKKNEHRREWNECTKRGGLCSDVKEDVRREGLVIREEEKAALFPSSRDRHILIR